MSVKKIKKIFSGHIRILFYCQVVLLLLLVSINPSFFSVNTLRSMAFQVAEIGLLTLAMVIPMITGGINLAIISTANISVLVLAWGLSSSTTFVGFALVFLLSIVVSIVIGMIIGSIVAYFKVHPILVTLGMMTLIKGIGLYFTKGSAISGFPEYILAIGNKVFLGIPNSVWLLAVVTLITAIILKHSPFGVSIYMIGSNITAAEYSGIHTKRVLILSYVYSSLLCFLAGIIMMSRFNSVRIDYGESYLLLTVLVAVLGGIDPIGGKGTIRGVVMALIVLQTLASGLNSLRFSTHLAMAFNGFILIGVFVIARVHKNKRSIA